MDGTIIQNKKNIDYNFRLNDYLLNLVIKFK